jgi:hypothetical protein
MKFNFSSLATHKRINLHLRGAHYATETLGDKRYFLHIDMRAAALEAVLFSD